MLLVFLYFMEVVEDTLQEWEATNRTPHLRFDCQDVKSPKTAVPAAVLA